MRRPNQTLISLAALAAVAGCSKAGKSGPIVAQGDGVVVTAEHLKMKLDDMAPVVRARYAALDQKKELLQKVLVFELLLNEAKAQKLDQDPRLQEEFHTLLVNTVIRNAKERGSDLPVSDLEVLKYYEDHRGEFQAPEARRVAQVFLKAEKGSPERAKRASEARKIAAQVKTADPKAVVAFPSAVQKYSEDAGSKGRGGDLGDTALTRDQIEKQYGREVADAAFALAQPGEVSGVVESQQGLHILKVLQIRPALNQPLDEVKAEIAGRIRRTRQDADYQAYLDGLRRRAAAIQMSDAELEKIVVPAQQSTATSNVPDYHGR
jgi:parvulin-like peptidyl-prolyl isomerase